MKSRELSRTLPSEIPLLNFGGADRVVARHKGHPMTTAALLSEAKVLAEELPERSHVLNACGTRYPFLVAFLAALLRGQITVLPNDRTQRVTLALQERFPGLYCLADKATPHEGLEILQVGLKHPPGPPGAEIPMIEAGRTAAITFTSGSTGQPMPSEKSVISLATTARAIAERFGLDGAPPATIVATVPPQHMYGLETSIALPLWSSASVCSTRPFYPADIAAALSNMPAVRILVTTPIHLSALLSAQVELPELSMIISATAPLTAKTARKAEDQFRTAVFEIYGFSEAGTVATRRTVESARWLACGDLTLRRKGETSFVHGPHFPEPVPMNDIIDLHSPREFEMRGRMSDNINIAGKRASQSGLNAILNEIEGVTDGAFYLGHEDGNGDDKVARLIAFVVAPAHSAEDIRAELRRNVDPTFMPRQIYLVPSLPRVESGKLTRAALAELAKRMSERRT